MYGKLKIIKEILNTQGTKMDQRYDRNPIYTKEELENMTLEELIKISDKIHHPWGRNW